MAKVGRDRSPPRTVRHMKSRDRKTICQKICPRRRVRLSQCFNVIDECTNEIIARPSAAALKEHVPLSVFALSRFNVALLGDKPRAMDEGPEFAHRRFLRLKITLPLSFDRSNRGRARR